MNKVQAAVFVLVLVGAGVLFSWGLPFAAAKGPESQLLAAPYTAELVSGTVTFPAQWELDLVATSAGSARASRSDVTVIATDAIWFGSSQRLLANINDLLLDGAASLPSVPDDAKGLELETYVLEASMDEVPVSINVSRHDVSVVLVLVKGSQQNREKVATDLEAIVDSIDITAPSIDVEARQ